MATVQGPTESQRHATWLLLALVSLSLALKYKAYRSGDSVAWTDWALPSLIAIATVAGTYGPHYLNRSRMRVANALLWLVAIPVLFFSFLSIVG